MNKSKQQRPRGARPFSSRSSRDAFTPRRAVVLGGIGGGGRYEPQQREKRRARPGFPGSAEPRPQPEGYRGGGFGGGRGKRKKQSGENIDVSRFVNKSVVVEEEKPYVPTHRFSDFAIDEKLMTNIERKNYEIPTAIQDRAIPDVLKGRDVIGIANTGEGKTAAFLIPLINKMIHKPESRVLVMVPTRELALQIDEEFMGFSRGLGIYSVLLVGGASMGMQIERLRRNVRMIIGTPGRIKDLIDRGELDLTKTHNLVLDEADRMLDMGFIHDIKEIIGYMPQERHTLFFSATFSRDIEQLAERLLKDPLKISVKKHDTSKNVEQDIVRVNSRDEKFPKLCELLKGEGFEKVIIFGRTKHGVEKLGRALQREGFHAVSIHGDKSQPQRQAALRAFKEGKANVFVATDVAARGLDIPNVSHVINYDVPQTYDDYVHRIGRTGRAGKKGNALTFVGGE